MKPKDYLRWLGWILLVLGVVGYVAGDFLGATWSLGGGEALGRLVVGIILLAAAYYAKDVNLLKWLSVLVALAGLYLAYYGWFVSMDYYGYAKFELIDNLLHLVFGVWGLWVVWGKRK